MNKKMYIVRGVSGAGKSTIVRELSRDMTDVAHYEADMYFVDESGNYMFDVDNLHRAHRWCQNKVEEQLKNNVENVFVSNTFTTEREMKPYIEMANNYGYTVFSFIVENINGTTSVHGVPEHTLENQKKRFVVRL